MHYLPSRTDASQYEGPTASRRVRSEMKGDNRCIIEALHQQILGLNHSASARSSTLEDGFELAGNVVLALNAHRRETGRWEKDSCIIREVLDELRNFLAAERD